MGNMETSRGVAEPLLNLLLLNAIFVGVAALLLRGRGVTLAQAGLQKPTRRQVAWTVSGGLLLFAAVFAWGTLLNVALRAVLPPTIWHTLLGWNRAAGAEGLFKRLPTPRARLLFALGGIVLAPFGEEVFFRGWLYTALRAKVGVGIGIILSGAIFGLAHVSPLAFAVLFPMGMLLAWVYERTGSLWTAMGLHATNNALAFGLLWLFPGWGV